MSMSPSEKQDLLRFTSHSRRNSNAYVDTLSNAALIAFLQYEQIKGQISSQPETIFAFDIFLNFVVGLAIDKAGGILVKKLVGRMVGRVANSRMVVGKFMNTLPDVRKSNITSNYLSAEISSSFYFDKYGKYLKAQRLEQANIANFQFGASLVHDRLMSVQLKERLNKGFKSASKKKYLLSETVTLVDSALAYAVNQKFLNDILFDELENAIRLDIIQNRKDFDKSREGLTSLHAPLHDDRNYYSLDKAREQLILYFEFILWSITFAQVYISSYKKGHKITLQSTGNNARLVLFDDIGKDQDLTKYLVNRLGNQAIKYKYEENIWSRADWLRVRLRAAGEVGEKRKSDFGNIELN